MKKLALALLLAVCLVKAAHPADNDKRTYIFAAGVLGHPYWNAAYAGFDYAVRKFGVEIKKAGPQDWNRLLRNSLISCPQERMSIT